MIGPRATGDDEMPKVTKLRPKGRSATRLVLEVDGKSFATVSPELYARHDLHVGEEADPAVLEAIRVESEMLGTNDRALRMLSARSRGSRELERKLVQKGSPKEEAKETVATLVASGVLDDARFAKDYARSKLLSGHGPRRIAAELAQKGVGTLVCRDAVDAAVADPTVDLSGIVDRLIEQKLRKDGRLDEQARTRRLLDFLTRRGFGGAEIRRGLALAKRTGERS